MVVHEGSGPADREKLARVALSRPKKALGQHFLTDRSILGAIVDAARVGSDDTVVEIGPGRGSLTELLASSASRVVAVEVDAELAALLQDTAPANVEAVVADARDADANVLLGGCIPYKLVGNLPYYAAMPILRRFLEGACKPDVAVILVQLEVAREICAEPGHMSLLSVGVQLYGKPRVVRRVRPGAFHPPPKVTSAIVAVDVYARPAEGVEDTADFFHMVRAGFSAPRKQLHNALAQGLAIAPAEAARLLEKAAIDPARRAQTLSLGEWARLQRCWSPGN